MHIDAMESDILSYRHFYRGNMTHFFLGKKIWLFQKLVLIFFTLVPRGIMPHKKNPSFSQKFQIMSNFSSDFFVAFKSCLKECFNST